MVGQKRTMKTVTTSRAIYQILLGWKIRKYYYETDELPKPNPNQEQLGQKVAFGPLFPTANNFFVGWDWFYVGNRLPET